MDCFGLACDRIGKQSRRLGNLQKADWRFRRRRAQRGAGGGNTMTRQQDALILGLAGLVPFWGMAIAVWAVRDPGPQYALLQAQLAWGALILAFLSGARWAMILGGAGQSSRRMMLFGGIPAVSLGALLLPPDLGLALLIAAHGLLLAVELSRPSRAEGPPWYPRLRSGLSAGAILAMTVTWAAA